MRTEAAVVEAEVPSKPGRSKSSGWLTYAAGSLVLAMMAGGLIASALQTAPVHEAPQAASFSESDQDTYQGNDKAPADLSGARVLVPSLGLETPWTEVGLHDGLLEIPSAPTAGWYNQSAVPGADAGTTVVAAHVDYPDQTLTPFGQLAKIGKGAPVYIVNDSGKVFEYKVTALEQTKQTTLPQRIFTRAGAPRLVLVTCAGKSIPESERRGTQWGYEDNLIVTAELVPAK